MLRLTVQTEFRSSHSLGVPEHRRDELGEICDIEHGHQYFLRATFIGSPSSVSGVLCERQTLSNLMSHTVRAHLHNQNLNSILPQTSGEAIAKWCFEQLQQQDVKTVQLERVELVETKKNSFHYPALSAQPWHLR